LSTRLPGAPLGDSKQRILVSLGDALNHRLPLILKRDGVVVRAVGTGGADIHHDLRPIGHRTLLRCDLERFLLRAVVALANGIVAPGGAHLTLSGHVSLP